MIEQIGRYKIERELGHGGFGYVYLAYDPQMDRKVAIKVLTKMDDQSLISRFRTEAIAAGNLHHRNIVTIHDYGEEEQKHYLVMEYLDGRNLQQIMAAKEPLALWQKVDIMSQIAEGLNCAHQSGVVHRDVKPANVIVQRDGTVKILDFGIARLTQRDDTRLTQTGYMVGTVHYMAPEQLSTEGAVDALSDIWSYGVIYYEVLTGRHPFAAQDQAQLMYRIMNQEPEHIAKFVPECPEVLDRIVARLLAKQRENRYQSLADVQYDAQPVLRELKRQQASGLLAQAAGLVDDGRYEEARPSIQSILDLDPGNAEARRLRDRLALALRRQAVRPKVAELLATVETQAKVLNYPGAIDALKKAIALDPADPLLPQRMKALQLKQQQNDLAQRCLLEARQQFELRNLTEAFRQAKEAVKADPEAQDAAQLLDKIQREIGQRERERNIQRAVNRARELLVMEVFEEALELLTKAAQDYPGTERIEDLLRQTQRQIAEKKAREKVAAGIAAARNLLKKRSFAEAVGLLEGLNREFPADTELAGLLAFARDKVAGELRVAAIEKLGREAWSLAQNLDFDGAIRSIEEGLETYPDEDSLLRVMKATLAAKAEHEKSLAFEEGLARCRRLREQGAVKEALELCQELRRDNPGNAELARLLDELQREHDLAAEREAAAQQIATLMAEATRRADAGDWAGAVKILEEGMRRYPAAAKLKEAAEYMRRKKDETDSQLEIDAACADIKRTLAAGQLEVAAERLARARRECRPDPRFDALDARLQQAVFREQRLRAANEKIRDHSLSDAERELQAILDRDEQDTAARNLLGKLRSQRKAEERKQKYDAGRAEAGRLLRERQFDAALQALEALLADFPDDPLLLDEARVAREAKESAVRAETVARGRDAAEHFLRNKNFSKAIWVLEELQKRFPEEFGVAEDLKAARTAKEDYERKQAYAAALEEAERLIKARDFAGAIARLQDLERQFPEDPVVRDALLSAIAAQELNRRKKEADEGIAEAQRLLRDKVPEAVRLLQTLAQKFPEYVAIADLLRAAQDTQRNRALIAGRAEAEKLAAERSYEAAIRRYEALLKEYPDDRTSIEGLEAVKAAQAAEGRKQAYSKGRAEAEKLAADRSYEAAIRRYEALLKEYPGDRTSIEGLEAVKAAQAAEGRKQAYSQGRAEAEKLAAERSYEAAIRRYEALLKEYPGDRTSIEGLEAVRAAQAAEGRKQAYSQGRAEAEKLAAERSYEAAIRRFEALLKEYPGDRALAEGLEAVKAAQVAEGRKQTYSKGRAEAEKLAAERSYDAAIRRYEALLKEYPRDRDLVEGLETVKAAQAAEERKGYWRGRAEAEKLAAERSYDAAIRRYEALLKEYPRDRDLVEGLETVKAAQAAEERKQDYTRGRAEAERLAAARSYDTAVERYRVLLEQYPRDTALEEGLAAVTAARDAAERNRIYGLGRKAAEDSLRANNFAEALQVLEGLQKRFPDEPAIREDIKAVRDRQQDYDRKRAYSEGRGEAERLLAARDFPAAISWYQALLQQFPNDPLLQDALNAAIVAGDAYLRKREAARGRMEVERLLRERQTDQAIALLQALAQKFPEDVALADDLRAAVEARDQTLRTQALTAGRVAAEKLAAERSYEAAIRRYEELLKEYPGDRALAEGLAAVKDARVAELRKQAYDRGRTEAEKLYAAGSFDAAIKRYRALLEEYPSDKALEEGLAAAIAAKDAAIAAKDAAERRQIYTQGRADVERLERELKYDAAIKRLDELLGQFPHDRALEEYRESLVAAQKSREERLRIDKQLAQLEKLYKKGDAQGVKEGATRLMAEADTPRVRELLKWAEGVLKREAEPIPDPDAEAAPRPPRPKLLLAAAALPALVVLAAGLLYWNAHKQPPLTGSLSVSNENISFTWQKGTALPGPKSLTVTSNGAWTFSKSDEWLAAQRVPDEHSSDVAVSIAPERLAAGQYSGVLSISATGARDRNVHVKLTVQDASTPSKVEKPQVLTFGATPTTVSPGGSTNLCWQVSNNASSIVIWPGGGNNLNASGCESVNPAVTTTYILTATNSAGPVSEKTTVTVEAAKIDASTKVDQPPKVVNFGATQPNIAQGVSTQLCWQVANATSIAIAGVGGNLKANDCATVSPAATTTYTLTAANQFGQTPANATVTVTKPPTPADTITDQPVDCKDPHYPGLPTGRLSWRGELPPEATLILGRRLASVDGPTGQWAGDKLPGCEVSFTDKSPGIEITAPSATNKFSRLHVKNVSGAPLTSLHFSWQVVK